MGKCAGNSELCSSLSENPASSQLELSVGADEGATSSCVVCGASRSDCDDGLAAVVTFLFFLIKLRTVSDGWAPLLIQYSARSTFNELLLPGVFGSYVPMISINFPSRGLRLSATTIL